ncbi:MAG TPA: hypothetical protein VGM84_16715 [Steroidobacteraceae bacterium]
MGVELDGGGVVLGVVESGGGVVVDEELSVGGVVAEFVPSLAGGGAGGVDCIEDVSPFGELPGAVDCCFEQAASANSEVRQTNIKLRFIRSPLCVVPLQQRCRWLHLRVASVPARQAPRRPSAQHNAWVASGVPAGYPPWHTEGLKRQRRRCLSSP